MQEARLSDCSQSLQMCLRLRIAAGGRTRIRHPSTESPPNAITSASETSTDSEVLSVRDRCLDTTTTSMVFGSVLENIEVLGIEIRIPLEIIPWQISLFDSIDCA